MGEQKDTSMAAQAEAFKQILSLTIQEDIRDMKTMIKEFRHEFVEGLKDLRKEFKEEVGKVKIEDSQIRQIACDEIGSCKRAQDALLTNQDKRIDKLEDNQTWIVRSIIGTVVLAILALVIKT